MHSLKQLKATENKLKALKMRIKREQSCLRLKRKCKKLKEDKCTSKWEAAGRGTSQNNG